MSYQLVVFDIAGTTVVDKGNINYAFRKAFADKGYVVEKNDVNSVMGYEKMQAISILNNQYQFGLDNKEINDIHENFIAEMVHYYQNDDSLEPQPYALEMFEWLKSKNIKVALNTGFGRRITDAVLNNLQWNGHPFIDLVVCSNEVASGRPSALMIQKIMQQLNIHDSKEVVKIGDTAVDIKEGKNAGCGLVIAVTTGAYSKEELSAYHPDDIIDSLLALQEIIQSK